VDETESNHNKLLVRDKLINELELDIRSLQYEIKEQQTRHEGYLLQQKEVHQNEIQDLKQMHQDELEQKDSYYLKIKQDMMKKYHKCEIL
jgi:hypothetical protein